MIDLHCHILPGIDDGCKDMATTIEMAKAYIDNGVNKLVATSHIRSGMFDNTEKIIKDKVSSTRKELDNNQIDLDLKAGAEYFWDDSFLEKCKNHEQLLTLGDAKKHVLVEFNYLTRPVNLREMVFELKIHGITLIMAHPERYRFVKEDLNWVHDLVNAGMLLQGTLGPLSGIWGNESKSLLKKLLKLDLIHLISSDSHRPKDVHKYIGKTYEKLVDLVGSAQADYLLTKNPEKIFNGESV